MNILFPGRHIINTCFQEKYLFKTLQTPVEQLEFISKGKNKLKGRINQIIFAITSCNQDNSRYNPVPFHVRAIGVDRFARKYSDKLNVKYRIIGIPHYNNIANFGQNLLKEIHEQTGGELRLTPKNTIIVCSTPAVIKMYQNLGFNILPAEIVSIQPEKYSAETPVDIIKEIVASGENWITNKSIKEKLSPETFSLFLDFPEVPKRMIMLYKDPLLTETGGLTPTRNYSTYAYGMNKADVIGLKYNDIKKAILPGKIVDEGCADGALLVPISRDFPDSDLIGIDITGEFMARCRERQRAGEYGGTYVFFHQRNLVQPIFDADMIDTTICNSTTHELWSYGEQAKTLRTYLKEKFKQTKKGGRLIIRDVVSPENKKETVYLWCNSKDGLNKDVFKEFSDVKKLSKHIDQLSTYSKFIRFAEEFLEDMRLKKKRGKETKINFKEETINGMKFFELSLKDAVEFMTKKDYSDNWKSELNEEFAFWSFSEWKNELKKAGFTILENPNELEKSSRSYTNPWIVKNRFEGKLQLYKKTKKGLEKISWPVTNMVIIGEKKCD